MPDSGTNRNLCSGKFAEENGLSVNANETVKMFAANKMQLTCLGVTKLFVKYFQIERQITVYVMKELSDEYTDFDLFSKGHDTKLLNDLPKNHFPSLYLLLA